MTDEELLAAAHAGVPSSELAATLGVSRQRIHQRLRRADPAWRAPRGRPPKQPTPTARATTTAIDEQPRQIIDLTSPERGPFKPVELLTPAQVAQAFGVDPKTITRWARAGQIQSVKTLGGHRRYPRAAVEALLETE